MSITELNSTAKDLISVRQMIAELEAEALTDKLKAAWKNVSSNRFDSKAFKADHAGLYGQYSKATVSTRFVLSV